MRLTRTEPSVVPGIAAIGVVIGLLASCTVRNEVTICRVLEDQPDGRTEAEWAAYLHRASAVAPDDIAEDFSAAAVATRGRLNPRIDDAVLLHGSVPDATLDSFKRVEDYAFDRCGIDLFDEPSGPVGDRGNP